MIIRKSVIEKYEVEMGNNKEIEEVEMHRRSH